MTKSTGVRFVWERHIRMIQGLIKKMIKCKKYHTTTTKQLTHTYMLQILILEGSPCANNFRWLLFQKTGVFALYVAYKWRNSDMLLWAQVSFRHNSFMNSCYSLGHTRDAWRELQYSENIGLQQLHGCLPHSSTLHSMLLWNFRWQILSFVLHFRDFSMLGHFIPV